MGNTLELIIEFHISNSKPSSHIKSTTRHYPNSYLLSTLPLALISAINHMSHVTENSNIKLTSTNEENKTLLPLPPCTFTLAPAQGQLCVQDQTLHLVHVHTDRAGNKVSLMSLHPDEPSNSKLNNSDHKNITPPIQETNHPNPQVQPLGRVCVSVPLSDDPNINHTVILAITQVCNTIHHNEEYVGNIKEIVQITRVLQSRGQ